MLPNGGNKDKGCTHIPSKSPMDNTFENGATCNLQLSLSLFNMETHRNIFDAEISVFRIGTQWETKSHWTSSIGEYINSSYEHADEVQAARKAYTAMLDAWKRGDVAEYKSMLNAYQSLKRVAPVAIMQGVNPNRNNTDFTSFSDVVFLDIDHSKPDKEPNGNEWVTDWQELKRQLSALPFVAYMSLSAGGDGLHLFIPIKSHTKHEAHWRALKHLFKKHLGITIDPQTGNLGR